MPDAEFDELPLERRQQPLYSLLDMPKEAWPTDSNHVQRVETARKLFRNNPWLILDSSKRSEWFAAAKLRARTASTRTAEAYLSWALLL